MMLPEKGDNENWYDLRLSQIAVHKLINKVSLRFYSNFCLFIFRLFDNSLNCSKYKKHNCDYPLGSKHGAVKTTKNTVKLLISGLDWWETRQDKDKLSRMTLPYWIRKQLS
jgi:hypothetical protein